MPMSVVSPPETCATASKRRRTASRTSSWSSRTRPSAPRSDRRPVEFGAIRIHVNQELAQIQQLLETVLDILKIGGRLLVISFHSLEDRLIKRFIKAQSTPPKIPRGLPLRDSEIDSQIRLRAWRKAIKAGSSELSTNPRARSAILRVAERAA